MASLTGFPEQWLSSAREQITEHALKLIHNIYVMQQSGKMCDVAIQCSDGIITAHSIVLMSSCEAMQTVLHNITSSLINNTNLTQHTDPTLPLSNYPKCVVLLLVNYLYTGVLEKPQDKDEELFNELMARFGLKPCDAFSSDNAKSSAATCLNDQKPLDPNGIEKCSEIPELEHGNKGIKVKQEMDMGYEAEESTVNEGHVQDNATYTNGSKGENTDDYATKMDPFTARMNTVKVEVVQSKYNIDTNINNTGSKEHDVTTLNEAKVKSKKVRKGKERQKGERKITWKKENSCSICGKVFRSVRGGQNHQIRDMVLIM